VADNGSGIPRDHLRQIFEPFYTTKKDTGTGLGLWVSHGIVQKHGGSIRVRSRWPTAATPEPCFHLLTAKPRNQPGGMSLAFFLAHKTCRSRST
jgi:signal transduction histidine kinase